MIRVKKDDLGRWHWTFETDDHSRCLGLGSFHLKEDAERDAVEVARLLSRDPLVRREKRGRAWAWAAVWTLVLVVLYLTFLAVANSPGG